jgi:hypothetical protein
VRECREGTTYAQGGLSSYSRLLAILPASTRASNRFPVDVRGGGGERGYAAACQDLKTAVTAWRTIRDKGLTEFNALLSKDGLTTLTARQKLRPFRPVAGTGADDGRWLAKISHRIDLGPPAIRPSAFAT